MDPNYAILLGSDDSSGSDTDQCRNHITEPTKQNKTNTTLIIAVVVSVGGFAVLCAIGFVLCTPGALSAYRKKAIEPILEHWLHQKFAGQDATIGEDRAMTNLILAQGYHVNFQKKAIVYTNTPITYHTLHKMFTRWSRSNVRETIMMNKFIFLEKLNLSP